LAIAEEGDQLIIKTDTLKNTVEQSLKQRKLMTKSMSVDTRMEALCQPKSITKVIKRNY